MAEYQLNFDGFVPTFFCNGNHYLWLRVYSYEHFCKGYPYSYFNVAGSCWVQCFLFFRCIYG